MWRAVDWDRSRVGDINTLADAVLLMLDLVHEAAVEEVAGKVRALCDDADADATDPYVGMVTTVDLRNAIERDGP